MRVCYLKASHSANGASSLRCRNLVAQLRREPDVELQLSHLALPDVDGSDPDVLPTAVITAGNYDAIVVEAGLVDLSGRPRIPLDVATSYVKQAGVLIVLDVDINQAAEGWDVYQEARALFGAVPLSYRHSRHTIVNGHDEKNFYQQHQVLRCLTSDMSVALRFSGSLSGIDAILVSWPIQLAVGTADVIASGNSTSRTLQNDIFVDSLPRFPWATANLVGEGFALLVGGVVAHDVWASVNPDNVRWIVGLVRFFTDEVRREAEIYGRDRVSDRTSFLSLNADLDRRVRQHLDLSEEQRDEITMWSARQQDALERRFWLIIEETLAKEYPSKQARERVLVGLTSERRATLGATEGLFELLAKLYWKELAGVVKKNWPVFAARFDDNQRRFMEDMEAVNLRLHAHPKLNLSTAEVYRVYEAARRLNGQIGGEDSGHVGR